MRKQKLHFDNLDEVLTSSTSTRRKGTQQFETPMDVAAALTIPLPLSRPCVLDLQCGHGALVQAAAITAPRQDSRLLLGIDIDPTAAIGQVKLATPPARSVVRADCTKFLPLLIEAKAAFDLIVCNPPFSLRWKTLPSADLHSALRVPRFSDSTLYTFETMHRLLTKRGEGMMICNADTCRRLLEPSPLWRKTWLRLTMPNCFGGVLRDMEIAVVYFTAGHSAKAPAEVRVADSLPDTIRAALEPFALHRKKFISGDTVEKEWQSPTRKARRAGMPPRPSGSGSPMPNTPSATVGTSASATMAQSPAT